MIWSEIQHANPHQWLIVETLSAHTTSKQRRILDRSAVIDTCADGMQRYRELHRQHPLGCPYCREELEIYERR